MSKVKDRGSIDRIIHDQADALGGFTVLARDGVAGKIAGDQDRVGDNHLIVRVGGRLRGNDVVVETTVVSAIDAAQKEIHVDRIADWVKASPKLKHFQGS
ncbi:hypothetical protein [Euzebya tangerina]|uniref:hypothetical protein n=1 Tax=Euzebya tangerina TaxID=591198 RepID=UPI000E3233F5|nr:hypothetical protein [Euzebya tangerina]